MFRMSFLNPGLQAVFSVYLREYLLFPDTEVFENGMNEFIVHGFAGDFSQRMPGFGEVDGDEVCHEAVADGRSGTEYIV